MSTHEANDKSAWIRSAVVEYEDRLLRYAVRRTGCQETARDVVQEVFLRLCRQDRAGVEGHLAEWLYTVCRRRAIDVGRKESTMKIVSADVQSHTDTQPDGEATAVQREEAQQVEAALSTLSENQQEVIRLKFQHGLSYREIAGVTELSTSNVGYLIHTAIHNIRRQLSVDTELSP
jgi:RNA polymerase sigma factor (sigma-70 family)